MVEQVHYMGGGIPDWSNAITYTTAQLSSGITMPSDGVFICTGHSNDQQSSTTIGATYISINDINVSAAYYIGGVPGFLNVQCPVAQGDTVKSNRLLMTYAEYTIAFVPYR